MEAMMAVLAGGGMLLFLVFAGVAAALLVAASFAGVLGGIACLLDDPAARLRRSGAPRPRTTG